MPHRVMVAFHCLCLSDNNLSGKCIWFYSFLELYLAAQVSDPFMPAQSIVNV